MVWARAASSSASRCLIDETTPVITPTMKISPMARAIT